MAQFYALCKPPYHFALTLLLLVTVDSPSFTWQYFLTPRIAVLLIIAGLGSIAGFVPNLRAAVQKVTSNAVAVTAFRVVLLALFAVEIMFVVNSTYSPFIYFQF